MQSYAGRTIAQLIPHAFSTQTISLSTLRVILSVAKDLPFVSGCRYLAILGITATGNGEKFNKS